MKAIESDLVVCSADKVVPDATVLVEGGRVAGVCANAELAGLVSSGKLAAGDVIDRRGCLVMPGLVNTHMHQYGVLSHGIPPAQGVTGFESFLLDYWWPRIEDRVRKSEVLTTSLATMAEMLHSGTTSFCDILEAPLCEGDTLIAQGEQIERAGMRAIVSLESSERVSKANGEACLRQNAESAQHFSARGTGLVRGAICTHTTFTCPRGMIEHAKELACENGCLYQFHLCESRYELEWAMSHLGCTPLSVYNSAGALGPDTLAAQCVKLGEGDLDLLASSGTRAAHLPISNCEVGGGFAPVPSMLQKDVCLGLGTDGYVNDMFQVMRATFLVHKAACETTTVMDSKQVFSLATEKGAQAMGLSKVGRIESGWAADLVAYDMAPQPTPINEGNVFDQLVVFGRASSVRDVWVAGKRLMQDGRLLTLDEERNAAQLRQCADTFWRGL
ncbi:MAG: amidohydrolase family protein [Tractidigestivibacter sp.]|jgi:5-methylthioadenosine/S-adenosylhomocysteine deaminase|uniref:amidohydrolase family protein n=1 Tax=Tractidigestivibacter sp. TaxID=2847320 RepID=UPI003D8E320D